MSRPIIAVIVCAILIIGVVLLLRTSKKTPTEAAAVQSSEVTPTPLPSKPSPATASPEPTMTPAPAPTVAPTKIPTPPPTTATVSLKKPPTPIATAQPPAGPVGPGLPVTVVNAQTGAPLPGLKITAGGFNNAPAWSMGPWTTDGKGQFTAMLPAGAELSRLRFQIGGPWISKAAGAPPIIPYSEPGVEVTPEITTGAGSAPQARIALAPAIDVLVDVKISGQNPPYNMPVKLQLDGATAIGQTDSEGGKPAVFKADQETSAVVTVLAGGDNSKTTEREVTTFSLPQASGPLNVHASWIE